jgi:hypothetical protein
MPGIHAALDGFAQIIEIHLRLAFKIHRVNVDLSQKPEHSSLQGDYHDVVLVTKSAAPFFGHDADYLEVYFVDFYECTDRVVSAIEFAHDNAEMVMSGSCLVPTQSEAIELLRDVTQKAFEQGYSIGAHIDQSLSRDEIYDECVVHTKLAWQQEWDEENKRRGLD